MTVPCGGCLGCRLDRSRTWAFRCVHESQSWPDNRFVTLTYDDDHLPYGGTLVKSHAQNFLKRLRHKLPGPIRYFMCGEYGDENLRPHYHLILFNVAFNDELPVAHGPNGAVYRDSKILHDTWGKGFTQIGDVNMQTCAYVARYVLKKVTGNAAEEHYSRMVESTGEIISVVPEYNAMSRRPGIGKNWYEKYKTDLYPSDKVPVPGEGVFSKSPRFYDEQLKLEDPVTFEQIKRARESFARNNQSEYTPSRLMQKYKVKKAQLAQLKRTL